MDDEYHKAEAVLDAIVLRKELDILREENKMLKLILTDQLCPRPRHTRSGGQRQSREMRDKWIHYHQHKTQVLCELAIRHNVPKTAISWQTVKQETDKTYVSSTNPLVFSSGLEPETLSS